MTTTGQARPRSGSSFVTAFEKWFQANYAENITAGARYLMRCAATGPSNSVVWDYLQLAAPTGQYTADAFKDAARIILQKKAK